MATFTMSVLFYCTGLRRKVISVIVLTHFKGGWRFFLHIETLQNVADFEYQWFSTVFFIV